MISSCFCFEPRNNMNACALRRLAASMPESGRQEGKECKQLIAKVLHQQIDRMFL
jgi:hypothetical protein